jgi:hypothetical protein
MARTPIRRFAPQTLEARTLHLHTDLDFKTGKAERAYSLDGMHWKPIGGEFKAAYDWRTGTFQVPQFTIVCYNSIPGDSYVDVDSLRFFDKQNEGTPQN